MDSRLFDFYVPHELRDSEPLLSEVLTENDDSLSDSAQTRRDNAITLVVAIVLFSINALVIGTAIAKFSRSVNALATTDAEVQQTMGQWISSRKLL